MTPYNVVYNGYKKGKFVFTTEEGIIANLYYYEVCPCMNEVETALLMRNFINHKFIIGVYPPFDGYYIREKMTELGLIYEIYDAKTKLPSGLTYVTKDEIPKKLKGKVVHLNGKKIVLKKYE